MELSIEFEKDTIIFYKMLNAFLTDEEMVQGLEEIIGEENRHVRVLEEWQEEEE